MPNAPSAPPYEGDAFYAKAMQTLDEAAIPFLVGGAYALRVYTGIVRDTKDFDMFVRPGDIHRALDAFAQEGFETNLAHPHWLAKAICGGWFVDLIFRAGNGLCEVEDSWFARAPKREMLGREILLCPPEEIVRMKCFIMERERFDGADVAHLLLRYAERLDWNLLLAEFGPDWQLLLSHLILFGYIYPSERGRIPRWVGEELLRKMESEAGEPAAKICRGTLISRSQYLPDVGLWGYRDARLDGRSRITPEQLAEWTAAIDSKDLARGESNSAL